MWPAYPNNRLHVYYAKTPETMGSAPCAALPPVTKKKITFFLICQFPQIDHQNNQEEISDLLCDSRCPQQIRLFARLRFMRPHQPPRFRFHDFFRFHPPPLPPMCRIVPKMIVVDDHGHKLSKKPSRVNVRQLLFV